VLPAVEREVERLGHFGPALCAQSTHPAARLGAVARRRRPNAVEYRAGVRVELDDVEAICRRQPLDRQIQCFLRLDKRGAAHGA
jgi:hypothetical protein